MKAVIFNEPGGPEVLQLGDWPTPRPSSGEVLVKVHASALNRADTLQRRGFYPPPPGASPILGLEMAGEIVEVGSEVQNWKIGDRVCALLPGGGYAAFVTVPSALLLPIPERWSYEEAAGIPEVFLTAYQALVWLADLQANETILIHAGASGVGTAALQIARKIGAQSIVTASAGKHELCVQLGAKQAIDYKTEDFEQVISNQAVGGGVDVIIDFIGAPYFERNINILKPDGRLIVLAFMGGNLASQLDLRKVLVKRLQIQGSTLRARSLEYKAKLTARLKSFCWNEFTDGSFFPVIDKIFDWEEVQQAHQRMEDNLNMGKIILKIS